MTALRFEGLETLRVVCSLGVVFLHVNDVAGYPSSLDWLTKLRDFALPVMVLTSFFLLTISLKNKFQPDFNDFFAHRIKRFWLPLMIWSSIYVLIIAFVFPVIFRIELFGESLSPRVFLSGYRHLWYLQFLLIGSLVSYPFIYTAFRNKKLFGVPSPVFCVLLTILYGLIYFFALKENLYHETDVNLNIFISQTGNYLLFIPLGIGFGLLSGKINYLFQKSNFRNLSIFLIFLTMMLHLLATGIPFTSELYGTAVFLAALQPWKANSSKIWKILATYSYGIYIVHFFGVQMLWLFMVKQNVGLNAFGVLILTLVIYFLSFLVAIGLRKLLPLDFLIPFVPANSAEKVRLMFWTNTNPIPQNYR